MMREQRPDLVITQTDLPGMDGWAMAEAMPSEPALQRIPIVFLSSEGCDAERLRKLGRSPLDYIEKPFRAESLRQRVEHWRQAARIAATQAPSNRPYPTHDAPKVEVCARGQTHMIDGMLEQLSLSSLLRVMEIESKDGILYLHQHGHRHGHEHTKQKQGHLFLQQGRVVNARIDQGTGLDAKQALFAMLSWSHGHFRFTAMEIDMKDEIRCSTAALLLEGTRLMHEMDEIREMDEMDKRAEQAERAPRPMVPAS